MAENFDLKSFAKEVGANTVYDSLNSDIKYFYPTGCKNLDIVLGGGGGGTGGMPSGRFMEIYGRESSGKSTITLCIAKSFVEFWKFMGEPCAVLWIEAESVFDKVRARYIGCDLSHFLIIEATCVEEAFRKIRDFIEKGEQKKVHTMVVLDTIAALPPEAELGDKSYAGGMMLKPRVLKAELSKIIPVLGRTDTPMIFVNQIYEGGGMYDATVSPGGSGLRFYASIRMEVSVANRIKRVLPSGDETGVAIETKGRTRKNKVTLPFQTCMLYIDGERGLLPLETAILFMEKTKSFSKSGSWKTLKLKIRKPDGTISEEEFKYQNINHFKSAAEKLGIDIMPYLEYEITKFYADVSVFLKASLIQDLWKYEEQLFGERSSTLTPEEQEIADLIAQKDILGVKDSDEE